MRTRIHSTMGIYSIFKAMSPDETHSDGTNLLSHQPYMRVSVSFALANFVLLF